MIETSLNDGVATVKMVRPPVNAFDQELVSKLAGALDEAVERGAGAVLLTGDGSVFSAGVDLKHLLAEPADYVDHFVRAMDRMFRAFFHCRLPVVALVNGHAIAGGCVLACAADFRIMMRGTGRIGIPELRVGLPFPPVAMEIMRMASPTGHPDLFLHGRRYGPEEAVTMGLVHEASYPDAGVTRALEHCNLLTEIPARTFYVTKRALRRSWILDPDRYEPALEEVIQVWRSREVREALESYVEANL